MEKKYRSDWHERLMRYVPLILWIGVIAFMSSGQASMSNTSRFIRPLLEFLFPNSPEETLQIYHAYIRKMAHITEYAILSFFAIRAFLSSRKDYLKKYSYIWAMVMVFIVAATDEFNQTSNLDRTGSVWDVLLDCFGGLLMICIVLFSKKFVGGDRAFRN